MGQFFPKKPAAFKNLCKLRTKKDKEFATFIVSILIVWDIENAGIDFWNRLISWNKSRYGLGVYVLEVSFGLVLCLTLRAGLERDFWFHLEPPPEWALLINFHPQFYLLSWISMFFPWKFDRIILIYQGWERPYWRLHSRKNAIKAFLSQSRICFLLKFVKMLIFSFMISW